MSENEHRGVRDLSQYDSMPTEALEQILRADAETPAEQESDIELILYVMEVLARRKKENQQSGRTAEQSWESFQQHYLPEQEIQKQNTTKLSGRRPWLRRMIACAAAVILILCIPLSSRAFSLAELLDVVARWAKETFSFVNGNAEQVSEPEIEDKIEYTSLQDLLSRNDIDCDIVPTWIPDGFVLKRVEKDITPLLETYRAFYVLDDRELEISVQLYLVQDSRKAEIGRLIEEIEIDGVCYYFFSNYNRLQVVWMDSDYECIITGDLNLEDAKKMINSIERG